MTNTQAWEAIAARLRPEAEPPLDDVEYGPGAPPDRELRLLGDLADKRVLDLGCGTGRAAISFARRGAHAIALDASAAMLAHGRRIAGPLEVRVEWHHGDLAELAFLRAESIDLAFSAEALDEVEDLDRVLRQVHRVLRPNAAFVFSLRHPMSLVLGRVGDETPGGLPLGNLEVQRSYFDESSTTVERDGESLVIWPRRLGVVLTSLHRAGYRVEILQEHGPAEGDVPTTVIWRARKLGS